MSTPSQDSRVLGWMPRRGVAPVFADCWTAVDIAWLLALALVPAPLPYEMGEGRIEIRVLRLDARLQLVPGVGRLLQALVGRDLAGQRLTEERMEGLAPDSVPDRLPPRPRQLQLLAPERDIDPRGIRLDDLGV